MAGERRGLKLHSIIEKLSEQCGRSSPSHDEESGDCGSQALSDHTYAAIKRKRRVTRLKKDNRVGSEEEELNSDDISIYTVEIPDSCSSGITDGVGDMHEDFELDKDNHLPERISKQQRCAVLAAWKKKNAEEMKAKKTCVEALEERQELGESSNCANDLCINVASFVKLGAQIKDIDPAISLEKCFVSKKGPFVGSDSLSSHIKETHPDLSIKRQRKGYKYLDVDEHQELVKQAEEKKDDKLPKGSVMKEGRRTSLRVQHLSKKPLYEELSAFEQMVSNNIRTIKEEKQNRQKTRQLYSQPAEREIMVAEDTDIESMDMEAMEAVDDDLCISVPEVLAMPAQVKDIDDDPAWSPLSYQESEDSSSSEEEEEIEPEKQTCYKCHKCGKTSFEKEWKRQHLKDNPKCRPEFKCNVCGKIMHYASSYSKHLSTHSSDRPYKCDICDSTFKDKGYLKKHIITHSGFKKYGCDKCDKRFAHRASLKQHLNRHDGFKPYKCNSCDEAFYTRTGLTTHEMHHSGETPYTCDKCGKGFAKSYGLKMHMTSHSDAKPYKCEVCGKAFKRKDHLREHCVIHSDVKPHKCDTCGRTFNQHICLRKHLPCREAERQEKREQKRKEKEMIEEEKKSRKTGSKVVTENDKRRKLVDKNADSKTNDKTFKIKKKKKGVDKMKKDKQKKKLKNNKEVITGKIKSTRGSSSKEIQSLKSKQNNKNDLKVSITGCANSLSPLNMPSDLIWSAAQGVCNEATVSSVSGTLQSRTNIVTLHASSMEDEDDFHMSSSIHLEDSSSLSAPMLSPSQLSTRGENSSTEPQPFVPFAAGGTGLNFFSQETLDQLVGDTETRAHEPTTELGQVLMSTLDTDENFLI